MKIHHIGYAVKDIAISSEKFEKLGYKNISGIVEDSERSVFIQFMEKDGYLIELIAPLNDKSHINTILRKIGSSPYHICYEVHDIDTEIENLLKSGYVLIEKPDEAVAIANKKAAFLFNKDIGILELLEG